MFKRERKRQELADRMVARDDLHNVAAAAQHATLLTADMVRRVQAAHKLGRHHRSSVESIRHARTSTAGLAEELRAVMRGALLEAPAPLQSSDLPPTRSHAKKAKPRSVIAIEDLPVAESVDGDLFTRPLEQTAITQRRQPIEVIAGEPARLADLALRARVVRLMQGGKSAREALDEVGAVEIHERSAQRWAARAMSGESVHDRRWTRVVQPRVLAIPVQQLILKQWNARYSASAKIITDLVRGDLAERRVLAERMGDTFAYEAPSVSTVKRFLGRLPEALRRQRGMANADFNKRDRMLGHTTPTTFANELWELDAQELNVRIRVLSGTAWVESRVWLLLVLDVHSRAVMGWTLATTRPDAWTACTALYRAMMPKPDDRLPMQGKPDAVKPDRGGEFMNEEFKRMLNVLGIGLTPAPPNYPNAKGKVESWFSALQQRITILPGYAADEAGVTDRAEVLLDRKYTFSQLSEWLRNDVISYHGRVHADLGATPLNVWLHTAPRHAVDEEQATLLLLHSTETRVVSHCSVQLIIEGRGGTYQHEALASWNGKAVLIRYNPDDMDSVLVYSAETGERICEALHEDLVSLEQLRDANRAIRKSLLQRTRAYHRDSWDADVERQADFDATYRPATGEKMPGIGDTPVGRAITRRGRRALKPPAPAVDPKLTALEKLFDPKNRYAS